VADNMLEEYRVGRTPNPDVLCNREIKFGAFWKKAKDLGTDFIATGHYAQIIDGKMKEGADKGKDQSYFLWTLTQDDLSHTLFPIGHLEKSEVRELAKKLKLPVAEKKDSQGICFIGQVSMDDFLSHYIHAEPGDVLSTEDKVIGRHKGSLYYTIGERHGFEVKDKRPDDGAYYVVAKDMAANTITVSNEIKKIEDLSPKKVLLKKVNWITEPADSNLEARIRYRGEKLKVKLALAESKLSVEFAEPVRGLSLGQSIVFYRSEDCLGGAIMDEVLL
jgi:tRNA-specific 2-thiouridylase